MRSTPAVWEERRDGRVGQVKGSEASRLSSFSGGYFCRRHLRQLGAAEDAVQDSAGDSTGRELARHGSGVGPLVWLSGVFCTEKQLRSMQLKGPTSLNGDCLVAPERLQSENMHTQRSSASQKRTKTRRSHRRLQGESPVALQLLGSMLERIAAASMMNCLSRFSSSDAC